MSQQENIEINIREDGARVVVRNLNDVADAAEKSATKIDKFIDKLKMQVDTYGFSAAQMAGYKASMMAANEQLVTQATLLGANIDAMKRENAEKRTAIATAAALDKATNSLITKLQAQIDTFAMTKGQAAAYNAAMQGMSVATQKQVEALTNQYEALKLDAAAKAANKKATDELAAANLRYALSFGPTRSMFESARSQSNIAEFKKTQTDIAEAIRVETAQRKSQELALQQVTRASDAYIQKLRLEYETMKMSASEKAAYIAMSQGFSVAVQKEAAALTEKIAMLRAETAAKEASRLATERAAASNLAYGLSFGPTRDMFEKAQAKRNIDEFKKTQESIDGASSALLNFKTIFISVMALQSAKTFIKWSDEAEMMAAKLKLITKNADEYREAQQAIYNTAQRTSTGIRETSQLYVKLYEPVKNLGGGLKEVSGIAEAFTSSLRVSGASTQEAAAATLQFGQAMASGRLQGDEFRSMAENNPRFMKALAEGMNVPISRLKEMSTEGKLTADVVGNAMLKSLTQLRDEAGKLNEALVSSAFQRLHNDVVIMIGDFNKATGVTGGLIDFLNTGAMVAAQFAKVFKDEVADGSKVASSSIDGVHIAIALLGSSIEIIAVLVSDFAFVIKGMGREIGGIAAQAKILLTATVGDFPEALRQIKVIRQEMITDAENSRAELDRFQSRITGATKKALEARAALKLQLKSGDTAEDTRFGNYGSAGSLQAIANEKELADIRSKLAGITKDYLKDLNALEIALKTGQITQQEYVRLTGELAKKVFDKSEAGKAAKKAAQEEETDYTRIIAMIKRRIEVQREELDNDAKLNMSQKMAADLMADLQSGHMKLAAVKGLSIEQQKKAIASGLEVLLNLSAENEKRKEIRKTEEDMLSGADKEIDRLTKLIEKRTIHNQEIGKSKDAIDAMTSKRMNESAAIDESTAAQIRNNAAYDEKAQQTLLAYAAKLDAIAAAKRKAAGVYAEGEQLEKQNAELELQEKHLKSLNSFLEPTRARAFGDSLSNSFGKVGEAIIQSTHALANFEAKSNQIEKARNDANIAYANDKQKLAETTEKLDALQLRNNVTSYAQMSAAAKGFFNEQSKGYQILTAAEKAFRAIELALAVKSTLEKTGLLAQFTAFFVASKGTEIAATESTVAPEIAATMAKGQAAAVTAVATQGSGDPYTAWGRIAAMAALMTGLGFAVAAGGGGGNDNIAADRQKLAGTGSVFGDAMAKSQSISKSIELTANNTGTTLLYTANMVRSLRNIESSIGGLTNLLVRGSGLTGNVAGIQRGGAETFAKSTLGLTLLGGPIGLVLDKLTGGLVGKLFGSIANSIFGGKVTTLDTGLTAGRTSLGGVLAGGLRTGQYTDTKTDGGWFSSDKYNTVVTGLGKEADDQFTKVITNIAQSITEAAKLLGVGGDDFTNKLNSFVIDLGKISLKGLTGEQIQKQLETIFSKLGDDMAKFAVGGLEQFQKVGEGYLETLVRVANDYVSINAILGAIGKTFGTVGIASIAAREELINLAGSLDNLASMTDFFGQNFLTDSERIAPVVKTVGDKFKELGISGVSTIEEFKKLVMSQDLTTEAGRKMYVALLQLAPAFKQIMDYNQKIADTQKQSALDTLNAQKESIQKQVDNWGKFYDTLNGYSASLLLSSASPLTPQQRYEEAKSQFEKTFAAAKGGDVTAQGNFVGAANAFLEASKLVNASGATYQSDFARVQQATEESKAFAKQQIDLGTASLNALTKQIELLQSINDAVQVVINGGNLKLPEDYLRPRPVKPGNGYEYTSINSDDLAMIVDELKLLRKEQAAQTEMMVSANYDASVKSAEKIVNGTKDVAKDTQWTNQNMPELR